MRYSLGKQILGSGSTGVVFDGVDNRTGEGVAIKVMDMKIPEDKKVLGLNHKNIVRTLEMPSAVGGLETIAGGSPKTFLVMEKCGETLRELLNRRHLVGEAFTHVEIVSIISQLREALIYLSRCKVIHRDIKPENIFFGAETDYSDLSRAVVKLGDLGLSIFLEERKMTSTRCGTPRYVSPQVLSGQSYTNKADLWSLGLILYELITGRFFVEEVTYETLADYLSKCRRHECLELGFHGNQLLRGLLKTEEKDRLSVSLLNESRWFSSRPASIVYDLTNEIRYEYRSIRTYVDFFKKTEELLIPLQRAHLCLLKDDSFFVIPRCLPPCSIYYTVRHTRTNIISPVEENLRVYHTKMGVAVFSHYLQRNHQVSLHERREIVDFILSL